METLTFITIRILGWLVFCFVIKYVIAYKLFSIIILLFNHKLTGSFCLTFLVLMKSNYCLDLKFFQNIYKKKTTQKIIIIMFTIFVF